MLKGLLVLLLSASALQAKENVIAIIDSGVDYMHADLMDRMWENPGEVKDNRRDDDGNTFRDDFYGWNFAGQNKDVINLSDAYLTGFSKAPFRMIKIQEDFFKAGYSTRPFIGCYCRATAPKHEPTFLEKLLGGTKDNSQKKPEPKKDSCGNVIPAPVDPCAKFDLKVAKVISPVDTKELDWLCRAQKDGGFAAEMGRFGNYIHGTHVAGISARIADDSKIMAIKLLPTEQREKQNPNMVYSGYAQKSKLYKEEVRSLVQKSLAVEDDPKKEGLRAKLMQKAIDGFATLNASSSLPAFQYANKMGASVVNGSFGVPQFALERIAKILHTAIYFRSPCKDEMEAIVKKLGDKMIAILGPELKKMSTTLFVFAAGNEGLDNDKTIAYPANLSTLPNVMSVAAAVDFEDLASFSNYGKKMVNVAAPGVIIESAMPDYEHANHLRISGTSQASPYVAGVAGKIMTLNPALTPAEVKMMIMAATDKKDFLVDKVMTDGVVNDELAFAMANKSVKVGVEKAIAGKYKIKEKASNRAWVKKLADAKKMPTIDPMPGFDMTGNDEELEKDIQKIVKEEQDKEKKK